MKTLTQNLKSTSRAAALVAILGLALAACGESESSDTPGVPHSFAVSECGGFAAATKSDDSFGSEVGYCDAERLQWSYDANTKTLKLANARAVLNCCGDHSVSVSEQGGVITITENDAPEQQGGRCLCMCVYDFSVELKQIEPGALQLKLVRDVTDDSAGAKELFSGALDLSAGSGSETLDESDASAWCGLEPQPQQPTISQTPEVSECGGFAATRESSDSDADFAGGYCDAEVLDWTYDSASARLRLANNRALLNCCGEHSISLDEQNGVYVITERDRPEAGGGRCDCMCVFDFALEARPILSGTISVKLVREVTDEGSAQQLYSGQLDLTAGAGSVVVDPTDVGPWCQSN